MSGTFSFLAALAMIGVVAALLFGLFAMVRGGSFGARYSNRMMRWRVVLQGVALLLLTLAFLFGRG